MAVPIPLMMLCSSKVTMQILSRAIFSIGKRLSFSLFAIGLPRRCPSCFVAASFTACLTQVATNWPIGEAGPPSSIVSPLFVEATDKLSVIVPVAKSPVYLLLMS